MFTPPQMAFLVAVFFTAAGFQTVTGFGFGLICAATLFLFFDPKVMVLLLVLPGLLAIYASLYQMRKNAPWRKVGAYIAWALIGLPLGTLGLEYFPPRLLKGLMALMLFYTLFGRTYLSSLRFLQWRPLSGVLAGIGSGALGASGPPVVSWVHSKQWAYAEKAGATIAIFTINNTVRFPLYLLCGMYEEPKLLLFSAALFPVTIGGSFAGGWVARKLSDTAKHRIAQAAILALALMMTKDALF
jgi:uncharacterized membrane protein YfcA